MAERGRRSPTPREPPGPKAATELAARYLATRPRSRWEVERRLARAGASSEVIAGTLSRLAELGFVDDAAFARWWLEQRDRHAPRGRRMLEAELRQHGIGREVIEALREEIAQRAADDAPPPGDEALPRTDDERASAALARHLHGRAAPGDPRAQARLGAYLVRRGFDPETARRAIRAAVAADADEEEP